MCTSFILFTLDSIVNVKINKKKKSFTYKVDVLSSTYRNVLVLFQQESHVLKLPSGT